ncbi:Cid1 poly A polymerase family protein [Acanthocheilonema viteae]
MPAFSEYFVRNATSLPVPSFSSSSLNDCRFNSNVAYVHYWCNPFGGMQQYPALFADYFAGTLIPMSNIWPYCHHHYSMNLKRLFCHQPAATQHWPADATFFTASQIPRNSAYVTQPRLGKQRDTSPFSSGISRSSSIASSDYADSTSSGIGSQDSYHQQEESGNFPAHVAVASSSDAGCYSSSQIISLGDSNFENSGHNITGTSPIANYDSAIAGFYPQKQYSQSQLTGIQPHASLDVLVTAYSTYYPSAVKFCDLRKRCLTRKENYSSAGNLRFRTGAGFEDIVPSATCFHVCQSPNRFLIPLEAVESYIHCMESFSAQLAQSQITSGQVHQLPEFETTHFTSDLSSRGTNTVTNVTAEALSTCDNIRTGHENVSGVSHEIDSRISNIPGNIADENDCPTLSADKSNKIVQDHFLDEDSLLENLPKFEYCNGSGSNLACEFTRNVNWLQPKSPNTKSGFEIYGNDRYVSRQRKQVLQTRDIHQSTGISSRSANEGRSRGLPPPMPAYHQLNDNNWRRHSQNGPPSKNYLARPFSTSDGFVRSRDRNNYDKFYMSNMDRNRDCSQCNSSDRRSTPRVANIYRSANRSSFISYDKNSYHDGNIENSFNLMTSDDKRGHGTTASECLLHRSIKRNGSNRSRNSPPVYLALKSHREFVNIDNTEVGAIGSTREEKLGRNHSPQRSAENVQKIAHDVEQLTSLFCEHVAVCEEGTCDRVFVEDKKVTEKSVSPARSITELPQHDTVQTIDADILNFSSEASTPVQEPPESNIINNSGFELSKLDVLSEEIWYYHKAITQTEGLLNRKLHLRDVLYYAISPVFPMCGLYVVGSSLNGFGTNSSDMDLCLMITNKDLDQRTDAVVVLNMIQSALAETKWVSHMQLILAKVPILRIRFYEPFTDITVDLNANNSVAIRNTHLLCYYSSFDWRVRPLVSVVKEWAKRRDINDANRSSFTSYSLVLMVIHYLQCGLKQPILPSLQVVYPKRFSASADVRSLNVSSHLDPPPGWVTNETITLGELLIGFLEYYAFKFDYLKDAISVRLGSKTERTVVARQPSPYNSNIAQWNCICIEEPFTLSNTAHSVHNQMVFDAIRQAFVDGCYELDGNRDLKAFLDVGPINVSIGSLVGQRNALVSYENEITDIVSNGETPKSTIDFMEILQSGVESDITSSLSIDDQVTSTKSEISKTVLSECQPEQLQMKSDDEKQRVDLSRSFEVLTKEKNAVEEQQFAEQPVVRISYRSGSRANQRFLEFFLIFWEGC